MVVKETEVHTPRFPVIDGHNHLYMGGRFIVDEAEQLLDIMDGAHVRAYVSVDVGGVGRDPVADLAVTVKKFKEPYPDRFALFTFPDYRTLAEPNFGPKMAARLEECVKIGAQGIKLWKALGTELKDSDGRLLRLNDRRLDPVFEKAAELGVPVAIHVGDPVAFFDPLDANNERYEELQAHPDWHFYGPQFPPFMQIAEDLRETVRRHPKTTIIGCHVGCYPENLTFVGDMLRECPNYHVDIAARIAEIGRQPYSARRFFLEFQDRIIMGIDAFPPTVDVYRTYYRFLETDDEFFNYSPDGRQGQGRWCIYGMYLPDEVLRKVYGENVCRLVPGLHV